MAYMPLSARLALRIQKGTAVDGTPQLGSISISLVDATLTSDKAKAVSDALALVLSVPVLETHFTLVSLAEA